MASSWGTAWGTSWGAAWDIAPVAACPSQPSTWECRWGTSWGNAWAVTSPVEPSVVIYGGDDAPRKRKRRKERRELFQEIESTIHALLHPEEAIPERAAEFVGSTGVDDRARRAVDELLVLAQGQHDLLRRAASIRSDLERFRAEQARLAEQDDEDALIWMF